MEMIHLNGESSQSNSIKHDSVKLNNHVTSHSISYSHKYKLKPVDQLDQLQKWLMLILVKRKGVFKYSLYFWVISKTPRESRRTVPNISSTKP